MRKWFLDDGLLDPELNRGFLQKRSSDLTSAVLAIRCAESGAFLGTIGWSHWDKEKKAAEFGRLAIDPTEVRRLEKPRPHVADEATGLLARFAFERMGMVCLYADVMLSNERSLAVCRRIGMRATGYHVKNRPGGERIDMVRFELTNDSRTRAELPREGGRPRLGQEASVCLPCRA